MPFQRNDRSMPFTLTPITLFVGPSKLRDRTTCRPAMPGRLRSGATARTNGAGGALRASDPLANTAIALDENAAHPDVPVWLTNRVPSLPYTVLLARWLVLTSAG